MMKHKIWLIVGLAIATLNFVSFAQTAILVNLIAGIAVAGIAVVAYVRGLKYRRYGTR